VSPEEELKALNHELKRHRAVVKYAASILPEYVANKNTSIGVDICIAACKKLCDMGLTKEDQEALNSFSNPIELE